MRVCSLCIVIVETRIVLITCGSHDNATSVAQGLLEAKLVACVNIIPGIRSLYWWEGKIQDENELLLLVKTTEAKLEAVRELVLKHCIVIRLQSL